MAEVKVSPWLDEVHGRLGNIIIRRSASGRLFISRAPDMSKVKWSEPQQAQRQRFKAAVAYAKAALADPQVRLAYEKAAIQNKKHPRNLAISDYFKGGNLLGKSNPEG